MINQCHNFHSFSQWYNSGVDLWCRVNFLHLLPKGWTIIFLMGGKAISKGCEFFFSPLIVHDFVCRVGSTLWNNIFL